MEREWTVYQRRCLKQISNSFGSVKQLATFMGEGSLEDYCRDGQLSEEQMRAIEDFNVKGEPDAAEEVMEDEDEDDDDEESDDDHESDGDYKGRR